MCDNKIVNDDKLYKTKNGYEVVFYAFYPLQNIIHGAVRIHGTYHSVSWCINTGECPAEYNSHLNLVKDEPYKDFKIDDLVWASTDRHREKRYFAGVSDNGKPLCWLDGKTSHTVDKPTRSCSREWDKVEKVDI